MRICLMLHFHCLQIIRERERERERERVRERERREGER